MRSRGAEASALLLLLVSPAIAQAANASQSESSPSTITETITTTTTTSSSSFTRSLITTFDLAPTGTGSLYAAQCNSNWQAYITSSIDYAGEVSTLATSSWTYHNLSAQLTTLCDGSPRVLGALTTLATGTNSSVYYQFQNYTAPTPTCSINPSDCADLNAAYSQAYNDSAMSSSSLDLRLTLAAGATALTIANDFSTVTTTFAGPITAPPVLTIGGSAWTANADSQYILSPLNGTYVDTLTPNGTALYIPSIPFSYWDLQSVCTRTQANDCGRCAIYGGQVQLMYFPVPANISRDICAPSTSITVCPLGPTTASYVAGGYDNTPCPYAPFNATSTSDSGPYVVSDGYTFYRNRAYISVQTAYASNSCGFVGSQHPGSIIPMQSTDIYSIGGYHHAFIDAGYRFNFADLLPTVPASAFFLPSGSGGGCDAVDNNWNVYVDWLNGQPPASYGGICNTIVDAAYSPTLLVPLQIRTLDPAWSTCDLNLGGLYDPPRALTEQLTVATFSFPVAATTSSAEPAGTALSDNAPSTTASATPSTPTPTALPETATSTVQTPTALPEDDSSTASWAVTSTQLPETDTAPSTVAPTTTQDMGQIILSMLAPAESLLSSIAEASLSTAAESDPQSTPPQPTEGVSGSVEAFSSDATGSDSLSTSLGTSASISTEATAAPSSPSLVSPTSTSAILSNSAPLIVGPVRSAAYLVALLSIFHALCH